MELFSGILSSLGLSGAAGLNAYIPLLIVGALNHFGVMHLAEPYSLISNPWVILLVAFAVMAYRLYARLRGRRRAL